jgi:Tol biopolymer transport system component
LITPAPAEGTYADPSVKSPDGRWTALPAFETLSSGFHISLQVFNADKSRMWKPVDTTGDGLGYISPRPKHWSADGRYFYFSEVMTADGCSDVFPVENGWKRLDLETGAVDAYSLPEGRSHAFSSDDQFLAYTTAGSPVDLVVMDQISQTEKRIALPISAETGMQPEAGGTLWSPDGSSLVLVGLTGSLCQSPLPEFSLLTVNLSDMSVKPLAVGTNFIRPLKWGVEGKILVSDWNSKTWWILSSTGAITAAPNP